MSEVSTQQTKVNRLSRFIQENDREPTEQELSDIEKLSMKDNDKDIKIEDNQKTEDNKKIMLISQDNIQYEVSSNILELSELIKTMISNYDEDEDDDNTVPEMPLPNVRSCVLAKVIEYCRHYFKEPMSEIEKPLISSTLNEVVNAWYANFVDVDDEMVLEILLAANYMDIKPLLNLCCATIASKCKGKTIEEMSEYFRPLREKNELLYNTNVE